jgi:hypothetical protein
MRGVAVMFVAAPIRVRRMRGSEETWRPSTTREGERRVTQELCITPTLAMAQVEGEAMKYLQKSDVVSDLLLKIRR